MTTIREAKRLANPGPFLGSFDIIANAITTHGQNSTQESHHSALLETDNPILGLEVSMTDTPDRFGNRIESTLHVSAIGPFLSQPPEPDLAAAIPHAIVPSPDGLSNLYVPQYADMILNFSRQQGNASGPGRLLSYAPLSRHGAEAVGLQNEGGISNPAESLLLQLLAKQLELPVDVLGNDIGLLAERTRSHSINSGNSEVLTSGRVPNYARRIGGVDQIDYLITTPIFPSAPPVTDFTESLTGSTTLVSTTYRTKGNNLDEITTTVVVNQGFTPQTVIQNLNSNNIQAAIAQRTIARNRGRIHHHEVADSMLRVNQLTLPLVAIAQSVIPTPPAPNYRRPITRSR